MKVSNAYGLFIALIMMCLFSLVVYAAEDTRPADQTTKVVYLNPSETAEIWCPANQWFVEPPVYVDLIGEKYRVIVHCPMILEGKK